MRLLSVLCSLVLRASTPQADADAFPLKVDPQRGTAARFQPSEEASLFLFSLQGVPVGTVELRLDRASGRYTYRSRQLFARASDRTWVSRTGGFNVDRSSRIQHDTAFPESLWLWRQPTTAGCVTVREELGKKTGPACATELRGEEVRGTLYGQPFSARYADGWLLSLELGQATFKAVPPRTEPEETLDLFGSGFEITGRSEGALSLRPAPPSADLTSELTRWNEEDARALAAKVHAEFVDKRPTAEDLKRPSASDDAVAGSCLAHAKRFAARAEGLGYRVALVHGLVAEPGEDRAFPHAWVRVRTGWRSTLDLDPTFGREVSPQTHLPLFATRLPADDSRAGKLWLEMLAGRFRVTRGNGRP